MYSLKNQRGSTLLAAMGVTIVIAIAAATIASQTVSTHEFSALPRIRSNMAQAEMQIRHIALSPQSYLNCDSNVGPTSCNLNLTLINSISAAGIEIRNATYTPASLLLHAEIHSTYAKMPINPRILDLAIPAEVLQSPTFQCPDARPFFVGFDSTGTMICRAVSSRRCAVGQYVASIDRMTLEPVCVDAGGSISCPITQKVGSFNWSGGTTMTSTCVPRPPPAINPVVSINGGPPATPPPSPTPTPGPSPVASPSPLPSPPASPVPTATPPPSTCTIANSSAGGTGAATSEAGCNCNASHPQWHVAAGLCYATNECVIGHPIIWYEGTLGCAEYYNPPTTPLTYTVEIIGAPKHSMSNYCTTSPCYGDLWWHCNASGAIQHDAEDCNAGLRP